MTVMHKKELLTEFFYHPMLCLPQGVATQRTNKLTVSNSLTTLQSSVDDAEITRAENVETCFSNPSIIITLYFFVGHFTWDP
jgi:hypothetical protein